MQKARAHTLILEMLNMESMRARMCFFSASFCWMAFSPSDVMFLTQPRSSVFLTVMMAR